MAETAKYVYSFGGGKADGKSDMKALLGGKGDDVFNGDAFGPPVPSFDVCNGQQGNDLAFPGSCEQANQIEGDLTPPEE